MLLRITHDLRRSVETHRLTVEQRRREHIGIVAFEPGGGINNVGEARGMALGKSITAEAFDLPPAILREFLVVTVRSHSIEEFIAEAVDRSDTLERRHRAPQSIGLTWRKASSDDG